MSCCSITLSHTHIFKSQTFFSLSFPYSKRNNNILVAFHSRFPFSSTGFRTVSHAHTHTHTHTLNSIPSSLGAFSHIIFPFIHLTVPLLFSLHILFTCITGSTDRTHCVLCVTFAGAICTQRFRDKRPVDFYALALFSDIIQPQVFVFSKHKNKKQSTLSMWCVRTSVCVCKRMCVCVMCGGGMS